MDRMIRIGFVINPIAGMGGRVGLKGTDDVIEQAREMGAEPQADERAGSAIRRLSEAYTRHRLDTKMEWICAGGAMGEDVLVRNAVPEWDIIVVHHPGEKTSSEDTRALVGKAVALGVDLIVFTGGDGTARDVHGSAGDIPIFGIPSGVKMHSGIFALDPLTAGELLEHFIRGDLIIGSGEIMDLDEGKYRSGEWNIALFGIARTLHEPSFVQTGKLMVEEESIEDIVSGIASDLSEMMKEEDFVLIIGPGGTTYSIGECLGFEKTLLGVDVASKEGIIAIDCSESDLLRVLDDLESKGSLGRVRIVVSPIGGQGFFLGRGNLQISPSVVRRVGENNIIVVSTPNKLESTKVLRVDTGDRYLDESIKRSGGVKVMTGYRTYRLVRVA